MQYRRVCPVNHGHPHNFLKDGVEGRGLGLGVGGGSNLFIIAYFLSMKSGV
jgi:hypothetical protein